MHAAPPPPPETFGAYQKKDAKSNGVIGLMEMLAKELIDVFFDPGGWLVGWVGRRFVDCPDFGRSVDGKGWLVA